MNTQIEPWTPFTAAMCAEGADGYEAGSREEWVSAFQYLISSGDCTMPQQ